MQKNKQLNQANNSNIVSDVASTPRKINKDYSRLSEKDRSVQQFAEKCRSLLIEVQERSAVLQKYASDLVTMDKDLREAQRYFEDEYNSTNTELTEQEDEYMHKLATLRQQKEQITNSLSATTQTTSLIVEQISQFEKEYKSLDEKKINIDKNLSHPVPQLGIERIDFDIDQEKKNISDVDFEIQQTSENIETISEKSINLIQTLNIEIQNQNKKKKIVNDTKDKYGQESQSIKDNIDSSNQQFQSLSQDEVRFLGEQSLTQKKIQSLNQKIVNTDKMTAIIFQQLKPYKQNLAIFQSKLQKIKDDEKIFTDALTKKAQFERGINESTQRSKLRSKEIESQLELIRAQKKKVMVNHFMEEEKIENLVSEEKNALKSVAEVEEDISNFELDIMEVNKQMESIAAEYDVFQNDTLKYQKKLLQMQEVYKQLKDSINSSKKVLKRYVKQIKSVQDASLIPSDPEITKEKNLVDALLKGYRIQIAYTRDKCNNISNVIKTEELKNAIGQSEMRRINNSYKEHSKVKSFGNTTNLSTANDSSKGDNIKLLKKAIFDLEEKKKELEAKIVNSQKSMSEKTEIYTKSQNQLNQFKFDLDPKEIKLNQLKENMKTRFSVAQSLCESIRQVMLKVNKSIKDWSQDSMESKEITELKQWNSTITSLSDIVEEIQTKSQLGS